MQSDPKQFAVLSAWNDLAEREIPAFLFDQLSTQVVILDAMSLRLLSANDAALLALDLDLRGLRRKKIHALFDNLTEYRARAIILRLKKRKKPSFLLNVATKPKGQVDARASLHYLPGAKPTVMILVEPYALHKPLLDRISIAEERLRVAIEALDDGFVFYDKHDRLVTCNESYRKIYEKSAPAIVPGARFEEIVKYGLKNNQYSLGFSGPDAWLKQRMDQHFDSEHRSEQRLSDGRWLEIVERATSDGGRIGLRVDITDNKLRELEMRRQSRSDDLTGLFNRRGLSERLELLSQGLLEAESFVLFLIDLDRFKQVNDVYGHDAGDLVLKECAKRLTDFRPHPDVVARVGTDEFIVALHGAFSEDDIMKTADTLIERMNIPVDFQHQKLQVGASIGISVITVDGQSTVAEHITASDIALNEAKKEGGNYAVIFEPNMREEIVANLEFAKEIRRGLANNEFFPFFQPQIDTSTGRVIGFEALIRWCHPTKGMIPAFQFLQAAQRVGLTKVLDDLVMDLSCKAVREMLDWGLQGACISINLSIEQISDPRILNRLQDSLNTYALEPEHIRVELLESTLLDDRAVDIVNNVHRLIRAGFEVELDDFGTGHAAIATLRRFDVARIKVDRSLVSHIDKDSELQVITSALIDLAQNLGIDTLAEGVETMEEQAKLEEMGCHVVQGYLHAKPMPLEEVRKWLAVRGSIPQTGQQLQA